MGTKKKNNPGGCNCCGPASICSGGSRYGLTVTLSGFYDCTRTESCPNGVYDLTSLITPGVSGLITYWFECTDYRGACYGGSNPTSCWWRLSVPWVCVSNEFAVNGVFAIGAYAAMDVNQPIDSLLLGFSAGTDPESHSGTIFNCCDGGVNTTTVTARVDYLS